MTILEVIGYKGVVGNATYQWLRAIKPDNTKMAERDKGDPIPAYSKENDVIPFVCVPDAEVEQVCWEAASYADFIVVRSTVKPHTCATLQRELGTHIVHNPEFLREATPLLDIFNPPYILIGACCEAHGNYLKELYDPACTKIVLTDTVTSEVAKLTHNSYFACTISFWNEIEAIAQKAGSSGGRIGAIVSQDPRISTYGARFHHQFGGRCLPKDLGHMIEYAASRGVPASMLRATQKVNECQTS